MTNLLYVKKSKAFKPTDLLLVTIIIVIIGLSFSLAFQKNEEGQTVEIFLDGELLYRVPLNTDRIIELNNIGLVIIENNTVRVDEIDCPDKLCEHIGAISRAGYSIICLPNKLIVIVTGESEWDIIV